MTREPCWDDIRLAEVAALPDDHPELAHARTCTRCRARLIAFRRFAASGQPPAGARPAEARARIHAAMIEEIGAGSAGGTGTSLPPRPAPAWRTRFDARTWTKRDLGVLVAAAAAVAIVAFGWPTLERHRDGHSGEMRGSSEPAVLAVFGAVPVAGGLELRWRKVAEADHFEVVVLTRDMVPAYGPFDTQDTTFVLRAGIGLPPVASPDSLRWRVRALRGTQIVAESPARPLAPR